MKIAVVTDDHRTISAHFGRAGYYEIFTIENGKVTNRETVVKVNHHHAVLDDPHHESHSHNHDHNSMIEPISDCSVIITRGMGMGAYNALRTRSIRPVISDIEEINSAVEAYMAGTISDHLERLH